MGISPIGMGDCLRADERGGSVTVVRVARERPRPQDKTAEPVLIIGAGPAGLAAAAELGRLGVPAQIIERSDAVAAGAVRPVAAEHVPLELKTQARGPASSPVSRSSPCVTTRSATWSPSPHGTT